MFTYLLALAVCVPQARRWPVSFYPQFLILIGYVDIVSDRTISDIYINRKKWGEHKLS